MVKCIPDKLLDIQKEYYEILKNNESNLNANEFSIDSITYLIDEIKLLWLKYKNLIDKELERLVEINNCYFLAGAYYLDVKDNQHYFFKSFGEIHIINEPLIKLDAMIRVAHENNMSQEKNIDYFKSGYFDTLDVLNKYFDKFIFLPLNLLLDDLQDDFHENFNKFFFNILSEMFNNNFSNGKDFFSAYDTYEDIERDITTKLSFFLYSDKNDLNLSLREIIKKYEGHFPSINNPSESEEFFYFLFSKLLQPYNILWSCQVLNLSPYIRYNVAYYSFSSIEPFFDDEIFKSFFNKARLTFLFGYCIENKIFDGIDFDEYVDVLDDFNLEENIFKNIENKGLKRFDKNFFSEVQEIIKEEFDLLLTKIKQ